MIPDGAVVTDEASLQEALSGTPQEMPDTGGVKMETLEEMHDHWTSNPGSQAGDRRSRPGPLRV